MVVHHTCFSPNRSSPAIALGCSFVILQPRFFNIVAPMIDARSALKSWRKMPTVSLPKATMAKAVWVQARKILGSGCGYPTGDDAPKAGGRSFCWEN